MSTGTVENGRRRLVIEVYMAIGMQTYDAQNRREDLADIIGDISPTATPLLSGLGQTTAQNTLHEWLIDGLAASADNANAEGSDATIADLTAPLRTNNVTQIIRKVVQVTDTEAAVKHAGLTDMYALQLQKALKEWAKDAEKALIAGTRASGSSGVARRLGGVIEVVTTNATARASGTSLSETEFNDIMAGIWASTDKSADEVYVGQYLKRAISGFTAGSTKYIESKDKRLTNAVDVYESDFGVVKVFKHREVPIAAGSAGCLVINSDYFKVAYLNGRKPKHTPLSKTGSATKGMVEGELTLESIAEKASAYRKGYFVG